MSLYLLKSPSLQRYNSIQCVQTSCRISCGSTTVSDTFGDGITEKVSMIRSGYLKQKKTNLRAKICTYPSPVFSTRNQKHWLLKAQVLFSHFGNQESSHSCASAATKGMTELESLQAITSLGFFPDHILGFH